MRTERCAYVRVSKVGGREGDSFHSPDNPPSGIKVSINGVWQLKPVKIWDGTAWVSKPLKYHDGTQWQISTW